MMGVGEIGKPNRKEKKMKIVSFGFFVYGKMALRLGKW
jgi:hypothetical protein